MSEGRLLTRTAAAVSLEVSPLSQALADFMLSRQAMLCTPSTLTHYRYSAGLLVSWLQRRTVTRPDEVTASLVREWLAEDAGRLKPLALHARARGARTFCRFMLAEAYISKPVTFAMPRKGTPRLPCPTREEFSACLKACHTARDRALLLLLADSGLRRAEAASLRWGDVDFASGQVIVRSGKGRKARVSVVGARTRRALLAYRRTLPQPAADAPLFLSRDGLRLTADALASILERLGRRAGFALSPHMLRRFFAIESLRAGANLLAVQRMMGHASTEMTAHYAAMVADDLIASHAASGPLDSWL